MTLSLEPRVRIDVPEDAFHGDEPLVAIRRGPYVASVHRGTVALCDPDGHVRLAVGDPTQPAFLRSAAKPFQVLPAVLAGAVEKYGITQRELAVLAASHHAEERHMEAVLSVLEKIGLGEDALACGVHPPIDEETARQRVSAGVQPTPVCNNCSGAHTGMLAACVTRGWPVSGYGKPDHPLQREIREVLAEFAGLTAGGVEFAVDNCHVPTFRLPVQRAAQAFAQFVTGRGVSERLAAAAQQVVEAMTSYPEMVGGKDSFDTDLMRAAGGRVLAKGGADGFQGLGLRDQGLGMAIKISDGASRAIPPATLQVLRYVDVLGASAEGALAAWAQPEQFDHMGDLVGRVVPVFDLGGEA